MERPRCAKSLGQSALSSLSRTTTILSGEAVATAFTRGTIFFRKSWSQSSPAFEPRKCTCLITVLPSFPAKVGTQWYSVSPSPTTAILKVTLGYWSSDVFLDELSEEGNTGVSGTAPKPPDSQYSPRSNA